MRRARKRRKRRSRRDGIVLRKQTFISIAVGLAVLIAGGAAALVLGRGSGGGGTPRAEVEQVVIDNGNVVVNETAQAEFVIRNVGNAPLKIQGEPQVIVRDGC